MGKKANEKNYSIFSKLFISIGVLMMVGMVVTIIFEKYIFTAEPVLNYYTIGNWIQLTICFILFRWFWIKNKKSIQSSQQNDIWILLCTSCLILPIISIISRTIALFIKNIEITTISDSIRGVQFGIVFCIFLLFKKIYKYKFLEIAGYVIIIFYIFSFFGSSKPLFLREYLQSDGLKSTVTISLKEIMVSVSGTLAFFILGFFCTVKNRSNK